MIENNDKSSILEYANKMYKNEDYDAALSAVKKYLELDCSNKQALHIYYSIKIYNEMKAESDKNIILKEISNANKDIDLDEIREMIIKSLFKELQDISNDSFMDYFVVFKKYDAFFEDAFKKESYDALGAKFAQAFVSKFIEAAKESVKEVNDSPISLNNLIPFVKLSNYKYFTFIFTHKTLYNLTAFFVDNYIILHAGLASLTNAYFKTDKIINLNSADTYEIFPKKNYGIYFLSKGKIIFDLQPERKAKDKYHKRENGQNLKDLYDFLKSNNKNVILCGKPKENENFLSNNFK